MLSTLLNVNLDKVRDKIMNDLDTYLPNALSPLIKNDNEFYARITAKQIPWVPAKKMCDESNLDFEVKLSCPSYVVAMGIMELVYQQTGDFEDFETLVGFKAKTLPDDAYLLRLLYTKCPDHAIISCLPKRAKNTLNAMNQDLQNHLLVNALEQIRLHGIQKDKKAKTLDMSTIKGEITRLSNGYKAYYLAKYKIAKITSEINQVREIAKANPLVQAIITSYKIEENVQALGNQRNLPLPSPPTTHLNMTQSTNNGNSGFITRKSSYTLWPNK